MVSPVLDSGIPKRKEYSFRVVFDTTVSTASTPFNELLVYELRLQDFQLYQFHNYGFAEDVLNKLFASTEKRLIEKNRNWDEPDFPDYASFKVRFKPHSSNCLQVEERITKDILNECVLGRL